MANNIFDDKIVDIIERGKKLTFPERQQDWEKIVVLNASHGYYRVIEQALELMEKVQNGASQEEIQELFNQQNHSGMSSRFVCDALVLFTDKGLELWLKEIATPKTSPQAIAWAEKTAKANAQYAENKEKKDSISQNISELIEKGKTLTFPERQQEWEEMITTNNENGFALINKNTIKIMEALENGATIEEAQKILKQQRHSGTSETIVCDSVLLFSDKGKDFWEKTMEDTEISAKRLSWYAQVVQENAQYAENKAKSNSKN